MATLTATAEPLALNSGSPNVATLKIGGKPLAQAIVTGLHQTDWQGRVKLSDQPRTNQASYSENPSQLWNGSPSANGWNLGGSLTVAASGTAPNGGIAYSLTPTTANSGHFATPTLFAVTLGPQSATWILKANGYVYVKFVVGASYWNFNLSTGAQIAYSGSGSASSRSLGNGWWAISVSGTGSGGFNGSSHIEMLSASLSTVFAGDGISGILFGGVIVENAASTGVQILATSTPVTVTDYTQAGTQPQITLGQNPATGATLDWDGSGILPGQNWSWPLALPKISSDNFAYAPLVDNVLVTQMETGAPKRRRRFTYVPETLTGTLTLTGAQAATLETFVAMALRDVQPFDWKDLRDGSMASYIFTKRPTFTQVAGGVDLWSTAIELMKQ